jgi:hypothetical protein
VIGEAPFDAGGVQLTVACALPATAVTAVGAPGADASDSPTTSGSWSLDRRASGW